MSLYQQMELQLENGRMYGQHFQSMNNLQRDFQPTSRVSKQAEKARLEQERTRQFEFDFGRKFTPKQAH